MLASSGTVLPELVKYWQGLLDDHKNSLGNLAVAALHKPEQQPYALMALGRVQMLTDLITEATVHIKRSE
jgi:hypothetical protein